MANVRQAGGGGFSEWWNDIPPVTRVLFGLSIGTTLAARFGFLNGSNLLLVWPLIFKNFQLWRVGTCFIFWGRLSFQFLINMLFLYRYSGSLETTVYEGRTADYVFFLLFSATFMLLSTIFIPMMLLGAGLLSSIIYFWSRKNPNLVMSFMFGLKFKAIYLPWVLCAFKVLQGGMPIAELIGIVVGHLWYFLVDLYPLQSGRTLLKTPAILYKFFPSPYGAPVHLQRDPNAPPERGYAWGAGRPLGQN